MIDISQFELQTCIKKGESILIIPADDLLKGYESHYFYYNPDASLSFICSSNGAHTKNSKYPRTELRERGKEWNLKGINTLEAICRVIKLAGGRGVIFGQVHGTNSKLNPQLVKLFWREDNSIVVECRSDKNPEEHVQYNFGKYKLGQAITYIISFNDEKVTVTIADISKWKSKSFSFQNKYWDKQKYYFKAGNYLQNNQGDQESHVQFSQIKVSHQ